MEAFPLNEWFISQLVFFYYNDKSFSLYEFLLISLDLFLSKETETFWHRYVYSWIFLYLLYFFKSQGTILSNLECKDKFDISEKV